MLSPRQHAAIGLTAAFISLAAAAASAQVAGGNATFIDPPCSTGPGWVQPTSINNHGVVTAIAGCAEGPDGAWIWDKANGWRNIGVADPMTGYGVAPRAINNNGTLVGAGYEVDGGVNIVWLWNQAGGWRRSHAAPGITMLPFDINDNGVVTGLSNGSPSGRGGFLYSEGAGPTFFDGIEPLALNNTGQVVGQTPSFSTPTGIVLREPNATIRLLTPGSVGGVSDINNHGQAVGYMYIGGKAQAIVWQPDGSITAIPPFGGFEDPWEGGFIEFSRALAINDLGQVVGLSSTSSGWYVPFVWDPVSGLREILVPGVVGYVNPVGINNNGEVVADIPGANRGMYFTVPVPAPPDPGYTPAGTNVAAHPVDETTGTSPVGITFGNVTSAGSTTLETSTTWFPAPPSNFKIGLPPVYYDLHTTATFTGTATVCINYTGHFFLNESTLRVLHLENGAWVNRTVSLNTTTNMICANVTSFSPFVIVEPNYLQLTITPATVRRGGIAWIRGSITNPSTTEKQTARIEIETGGSCIPTIDKEFPVPLKKGETKSILLPLPILGRACVGSYTLTLTGKIGNTVIGAATATLTVTP